MENTATETFLTTLSQHVVSGANLLFMKRFDTGDRMLDTTVQLIFTTVFGSMMSGIIALYTKGLWIDLANWFRGFLWKGAYDPMKFDARFAPSKPRNGKIFVFSSPLMTFFSKEEFTTWWYKYHHHRMYNQPLTKNLPFPERLDEKALGAGDFRSTLEELNFSVALPVWRHSNGEFVFVIGNDREWYLNADNGEALRACLAHIRAHAESIKPVQKTTGPLMRNLGTFVQSEGVEWESTLSVHKTFDSLFFTQKEEILPVLRSFKAGTLYPRHLPIDNKLGILLHGPPGTGKTGFITALANFLERDVILVHTSRLQTRKDLDKLFNRHSQHACIYVFEEFDCMPGVTRRDLLLKDVAATATAVATPSNPAAPDPMAYTMMLMAQKEKSEELLEDMRRERLRAQDKLDLGYLLYKLDGLESVDNRIIVATTNHPERIDPALLRPGRFGIQLHLTKCTRQMLVDILVMGYQLDDDERIGLEKRLRDAPDQLWAPAEVLQLIITAADLEAAVEHILTQTPSAF